DERRRRRLHHDRLPLPAVGRCLDGGLLERLRLARRQRLRAAAPAEIGIARERMPAGGAGDDRALARRATAVRAEVGADDDARTARAADLTRAIADEREQRVELLQPAVEL